MGCWEHTTCNQHKMPKDRSPGWVGGCQENQYLPHTSNGISDLPTNPAFQGLVPIVLLSPPLFEAALFLAVRKWEGCHSLSDRGSVQEECLGAWDTRE